MGGNETMKWALTEHGKKYINHVCYTCKHLRIKLTEDPYEPGFICKLTNEETTECATCPDWEIEDD